MMYHNLDILSQNPAHVIYVIKNTQNTNTGSWQAIWDRLYKASSRYMKWK